MSHWHLMQMTVAFGMNDGWNWGDETGEGAIWGALTSQTTCQRAIEKKVKEWRLFLPFVFGGENWRIKRISCKSEIKKMKQSFANQFKRRQMCYLCAARRSFVRRMAVTRPAHDGCWCNESSIFPPLCLQMWLGERENEVGELKRLLLSIKTRA